MFPFQGHAPTSKVIQLYLYTDDYSCSMKMNDMQLLHRILRTMLVVLLSKVRLIDKIISFLLTRVRSPSADCDRPPLLRGNILPALRTSSFLFKLVSGRLLQV